MSSSSALDLLRTWLSRQLPEEAWRWLSDKAWDLRNAATDRDLYLTISLVPRKVGKDDLRLIDADFEAAERVRPGWRPLGWSADQAARILLLLSAKGENGAHKRWLDQLCVTADVGELITFYRGLPLYPAQPDYALRAMEGARTNMKAVFEAVAHHNPYPAEQFPENAWNHMVLKALFIGSTLDPIQRLGERANPTLMRMLCDYAHERWAAGRDVSPELWRCVGPFANDDAIDDLGRVLHTGTTREQWAAALALFACSAPRARAHLEAYPELVHDIDSGRLSWQALVRGNSGRSPHNV